MLTRKHKEIEPRRKEDRFGANKGENQEKKHRIKNHKFRAANKQYIFQFKRTSTIKKRKVSIQRTKLNIMSNKSITRRHKT